jgi:hypothetical protein
MINIGVEYKIPFILFLVWVCAPAGMLALRWYYPPTTRRIRYIATFGILVLMVAPPVCYRIIRCKTP